VEKGKGSVGEGTEEKRINKREEKRRGMEEKEQRR
jgi:hypothetical protein